MTLWVKWVEPFVDSDPVYMRCTAETAIKYSRYMFKKNGREVPDDKNCLDEFIVVNWASTYESEDPYGSE